MKKITLFARDYCDLDFSNIGISKKETEALKEKLRSVRFTGADFCNRSAEREKEVIPLLWELPQKQTNGNSEEKLRWNGIVGVLRLKYQDEQEEYDVTIKLGSRFDEENRNYFLHSLILAWLKGNDIDLTDYSTEASWEDIFRFLWVSIFKIHLLKADSTGIYKTYQYVEENTHRIRGRIDIPRHLRLNMGQDNGRISSKYRENTTDNYLNHLTIHAYLALKKQFPELTARIIDGDEKTRSVIRQLMCKAPSYARSNLRTLSAKLQNPIAHPYFINHEELRKVCLRILSGTGATVFHDSQTADMESGSMLFYLPDLWEAYVEHRILLRTGTKNVNWISQAGTKNFDGILDMRPDFVLYRSGNLQNERRIVLDAKCKPAWMLFPNLERIKSEGQKRSIREDIKQCLAYHTLFGADYTATIFPARTENNKYESVPVSIFDRRTAEGGSFRAIGIAVPGIHDTDTFAAWRERLAEQEEDAANYIARLICG